MLTRIVIPLLCRLFEDNLRQVDFTNSKSSFAVGKVILPLADEIVVKSELFDQFLFAQKDVTPERQGPGIMAGEVFNIGPGQ